MPRAKEIELQDKRPVSGDLCKELVVFEYKGLPTEVKDFVRLAKQVRLKMVTQSEEQLGERVSQFKMCFPGDEFGKFMTVLYEWKPGR